MHILKKYLLLFFFLLSLLGLGACQDLAQVLEPVIQISSQDPADPAVLEGEYYYSVQEVSAYIHSFQDLPDNYITKAEAEAMDWSPKDPVWVVGGDPFWNREGLLPEAPGRRYREADIQAGYTSHRGPERLVYSNDGLIFYTDDHYDSFQRLY